jgi:hypothetical protein
MLVRSLAGYMSAVLTEINERPPAAILAVAGNHETGFGGLFVHKRIRQICTRADTAASAPE